MAPFPPFTNGKIYVLIMLLVSFSLNMPQHFILEPIPPLFILLTAWYYNIGIYHNFLNYSFTDGHLSFIVFCHFTS